jgi:hypothetical protein
MEDMKNRSRKIELAIIMASNSIRLGKRGDIALAEQEWRQAVNTDPRIPGGRGPKAREGWNRLEAEGREREQRGRHRLSGEGS